MSKILLTGGAGYTPTPVVIKNSFFIFLNFILIVKFL
jgi:hypothetical protein